MASAEEKGSSSNGQCRKDTSYYGGTQGSLPPCGDLASPYVPMLEPLPERYSYTDALNNGTLFPALNLPFHLKVNAANVVNTPLNELQALEFVIAELGLYLDTHSDDEEAFYVYKKYVELEKKARDAYVRNKGPLFQTESAQHDSFAWVRDPWPWHLKD
jgi:spore coat protein JB